MSDDEGGVVTKPLLEPKVVQYCEICTLPVEYRDIVAKNPQMFGSEVATKVAALIGATAPAASTEEITKKTEDLKLEDGAGTEKGKEKEGETEGDKPKEEGEPKKEKKPKKEKEKFIVIERVSRNKRKSVTMVAGLELFSIDLKEASKLFGKKFACGASVVKDAPGLPDKIDIQGDVVEDLAKFLAEKFNVSLSSIYIVDGGKKTKASDL